MLELVDLNVDEAKALLLQRAIDRFGEEQLTPISGFSVLEAGYDLSLNILTFHFNVKGEKTSKCEAVKLERRKLNYTAHVPERRIR